MGAGFDLLACTIAVFLVISCQLAGASRILLHTAPGCSSHLFGHLAVGNELTKRGHQVAAVIEDWDLAQVRPKLPPTNVTFIVSHPYEDPTEGLRLFSQYRDVPGIPSLKVRFAICC